MSANSQSFFNYVLSNTTVRLIASTIVVFIAISVLKEIWISLRRRWNDDQKLRSFEKTKLTPRHWFFGHVAMVSYNRLNFLNNSIWSHLFKMILVLICIYG